MSFVPKRKSSMPKKTKVKSMEDYYPTIHDLPSLKRSRTLAFNRLSKILELAQLAHQDQRSLEKFQAYYSEIQKVVSNFESAHASILTVMDSSSEEAEDTIRSAFDENYFEIVTIYRRFARSSSEVSRSSEQSPSCSQTLIKLPKINLPNFSGNIKLWPEFYDVFNSLIHENGSLSDTERMHYLISSLSGDALGLIRTFPSTSSYYREAYDTLVARYRDKRELAFTCWREMININLKSQSAPEFRRVLDLFNENLMILKRLDLPTDKWDFVLCYLLLSKLDSKTRCAFEQAHPSSELPSYQQLRAFLYSQCEALVRDMHFSTPERYVTEKKKIPFNVSTQVKSSYTKLPVSTLYSNNEDSFDKQADQQAVTFMTASLPTSPIVYKCTFCGEGHAISHCKSFAQKSYLERVSYAKTHNWCFNCLKPSHELKNCRSIFNCQKCQQRHHTLLHQDNSETSLVSNDLERDQTRNDLNVLTNIGGSSVILLSTAQIVVRDSSGGYQTLRALIDSGSQAHFITERAAQRLGLACSTTSRNIRGLGQSCASVSGATQLEIAVGGQVMFTVKALTLPNICGKMPSAKVNKATWHHIQNLTLADPDCHVPANIDVLLGAEIFSSLLLPGRVSGGPDQPSALNSVFGWLLMGHAGYADDLGKSYSFFLQNDDLLLQEVKKLWELETIPSSTKLNPDEELCEHLYEMNHSRDSTGRYIVSLPFKKTDRPDSFPGSREIALRRFHSLERKLKADPLLQSQYSEFMADYLSSGHMSLVPIQDLPRGKYTIPHHFVLNPCSATTKLRAVFDASAKDVRGTSLNDVLLIGPKLQTNIVEILLRFRVHFVVFTADVRQMYRQILVKEEDRDYQRILWRFNPLEPVQEYRLNTVTYGISSAPFLACRTINQLVNDEGAGFPLAKEVLESDVYIDDIVTGTSSVPKMKAIKTQVCDLLRKGHFELRKFASNLPEVLADLPSEHCLTDFVSLDIDKQATVKVLGLKWTPRIDKFVFEVKPINRECTKRNMLSELARIFDPLGFLAPLTFIAKHFIQKLWLLNLGWDEAPPEEIRHQWARYIDQLPSIQTLEIPRCISVEGMHSCEFHGFADSSEAGYGAVIYMRCLDANHITQIFFLCSKARVAPLKKTSLPRLELCAAVLLADLMKFVKDVYSPIFPISETYAWSDSTVVLSWLRSHSSRWKTFVANRVSHIQDIIPPHQWNHVPTGDNPADIASRGQFPDDLTQNSLWWQGPDWLAQPYTYWPTNINLPVQNDVILSEERVQCFLTNDHVNILDSLLEKFSSLRKLQRVLAYCLRFINVISKTQNRGSELYVSRTELHIALMIVVKRVQEITFVDEIKRLKEGKLLSKSLRKLNPFLDDRGVLRVGGRLSRSGLEFEHKHPALLPRDSKLTFMLIDAVHREHCHPGINTMQYLLTQQFWILNPKRAIRHCLSKCVRCYRTHPKPLEPFMSDLPATRVNQVKPFSIVGVDYGGPFRIKLGKHRGAKIGKAYLCLFVCFATKAVHLEVASDLSSDAFVAALRRFVGRRGRVNIIYSDCGTNFVGANKDLMSLTKNASHTENIEFRFNPPSSPHFGGIWEIQIKAVKSHLYRVIGDQSLTFEEMNTLFVQIESMLNSRPLCPLGSDPNDLHVLTPGHFLTLEPLTSVPDQDLSHINITRLGRWQLIQRFQQDFWKRWKVEYLHSLTQRSKWNQHCQPLRVDSVVIIKYENTLPLHWPLAIVEKLHAGPDGVVRIATVRTANGSILTRPLAKLCPLPSQLE